MRATWLLQIASLRVVFIPYRDDVSHLIFHRTFNIEPLRQIPYRKRLIYIPEIPPE